MKKQDKCEHDFIYTPADNNQSLNIAVTMGVFEAYICKHCGINRDTFVSIEKEKIAKALYGSKEKRLKEIENLRNELEKKKELYNLEDEYIED